MAEATPAQIRAEQLVNKLWRDQELGSKVQKLAKETFPDAEIHTVDETLAPALAPLKAQNDTLAAELKAMREEREAERKAAKERADEEQKISFQDQIAKARDAYSLTDEGFDKMVARMKATGNYQDPEAAAAWVSSKEPPPPAPGPTFGPQSLNLFGSQKADENLALLHRDPERYADEQFALFQQNPDKYVAETFGGR